MTKGEESMTKGEESMTEGENGGFFETFKNDMQSILVEGLVTSIKSKADISKETEEVIIDAFTKYICAYTDITENLIIRLQSEMVEDLEHKKKECTNTCTVELLSMQKPNGEKQ